MTGEEAKKEIIDMANALQLIPNTPKGKAVSMALKALEQEPCEDCVSRIEALNSLDKVENKDSWYRLTDVMKMIRNLPPVIPQPKTGRWISGHEETGALGITYTEKICSNCGWSHSLVIPKNYCPNCGIKMVESEGKE